MPQGRARRWFVRIAVVLGVLVALLAGVLRCRYGGGERYADVSTPPLFGDDALEAVFHHPEPLGNIAVTAEGRVFFTVHPESRPEHHKLLELVGDEAVPFPDERWQREELGWNLGVFVDRRGRLWTVDHGNHAFEPVRVVAFDVDTRAPVFDHVFDDDVAQLGSLFNDLQVSDDGRWVYVADISFFRKNPAVVVLDTQTRTAKRRLEGHHSVVPQDWIIHSPTKTMTFFGGLVALKPGIDGLVLDDAGQWLYYAAMTHDGLYRVSTAALQDFALADAAVADTVEPVGKKPLSDGLSIDVDNNVYITDVEHRGIARLAPDGTLTTLIASPRVRWADGCSFDGQGRLWFTDSAIPDQMLRSKSHMRESAPYTIYRFDPGIPGIPGR
jgi:sugar lactone lactonase YvrE